MKKQERIDAAKKRIQELKTLIKYWIKKNETLRQETFKKG